MPVPPTYPGVYVDEVTSGVRTIAGADTSIAAFVGRAARGPTETPVTVTSFGGFEAGFGGLWEGSMLGFAVRDFFVNGGTTAIIVRLSRPEAGRGAKPARASLSMGTFTLVAAEDGAWGNALRARVDFATRPFDATLGESSTSLFNLFVRDDTTGMVEEHREVVVAPAAHPRLVSTVLARESRLVRVASMGRRRPTASGIAVDGEKTVWDDNTAPTNTKVETAASDGRVLTRASFIASGPKALKGLFALEQTAVFNLLVIPPYKNDATVDTAVVEQAAAYCEQRRAMYLVDGPPGWTDVAAVSSAFAAGFDTTIGTSSANAALFFPRLREPNPLRGDQVESFAAAGAVAGVIARTDTRRGVWKAPAGVDATLDGVSDLTVRFSDRDLGQLNALGVNCLRVVGPAGPVVWGARTMAGADVMASEWKYVPVRRLALFIEQSLERGTRWVVFEPNDEPLWAQIRSAVGTFMHELFRQGAFQGASPKDAYFVKCDQTTTTQADIEGGIVNLEVGFAPLKPAEFVVIRLHQRAGQAAPIVRTAPTATWSDLSVAEKQAQILHDLCDQARDRVTINGGHGAVSRSSDLGLTALFVGDTAARATASEVIAADLHLDLFRVDLSGVVSKYIGETEKNLRRVFDAAEDGGAVLFFDEADALFGQRTEVSDTHDRYANLAVDYLFDRLETYPGVAILATNRRDAVDPAFLRRIRFVVQFRARRGG